MFIAMRHLLLGLILFSGIQSWANDTLTVAQLLARGAAYAQQQDWRAALQRFDSARVMAQQQGDTALWLQTVDSLLRVEERALTGKKKNLDVQLKTSDSSFVISGGKLGERITRWEKLRDTLLVWQGYDLSQPWRDTSQLYEVGFTEMPDLHFVLPDSLSHWSFDSVRKHPGRFRLIEDPDFAPSVQWLRLRLRNDSDSTFQAYLRLGSEDREEGFWTQVEAYWQPDGKNWQRYATGWETDLPGKALPYPGCLLPLLVPAQSDQWLYLRIDGHRGIEDFADFFVQHFDFRSWLKAEQSVNSSSSLFLGILLIQAVYFLFLFLTTYDRSYISYVIFISGLVGLTLAFGYVADWTPKSDALQAILIFLSSLACYYGLVLFSYHFLKTPDQVPISRRWLRRLLWAMPVLIGIPVILATVLGLLKVISSFAIVVGILFVISTLMILLLFILSLFLGVIMSWRSLKQGYKPARSFLLAQGLLLLGGLFPLGIMFMSIFIDEQPEWLSLRFLIESLQVGIILQLSFMGLSVGQKRRLLEGEKLEAEQSLNQELSRLNQAFSRFVPMEFLRAIGKQSVLEVGLGDSVEKEVTVLFSDIRNYTTLSEQMSPAETFRFINAYLGEVAPEIRRKGGFVNQFLGDGIMALYIENPLAALESALAMQEALARFNQRREDPIRVGIGLHGGPLMMGVIGDADRLDAGVVADAVNTSARMEGLTKYFGASLLVSETIVGLLPRDYPAAHRYVGQVIVKGRRQPLAIYDFFEADPAEICALKQATLPDFKAGLEAYLDRDFEAAVAAFQRVLDHHPQDLAAQRYQAQAMQFAREGVPADWTGVEVMLEK